MANTSTQPLLLTGKLLLSVLVGYALIYPFLQPEPVSIAEELAMRGLAGALSVAAVFFWLLSFGMPLIGVLCCS